MSIGNVSSYTNAIKKFADNGTMNDDVAQAIVEMLKHRNVYAHKKSSSVINTNLRSIVDLYQETKPKGKPRLVIEGMVKAALLVILSATSVFFLLGAVAGFLLSIPLFLITASLSVSLTYEWAPVSVQKWIDQDDPRSLGAVARGVLVASVGWAFAIADIFCEEGHIEKKQEELNGYVGSFLAMHKDSLQEMFEA